VQIAIRQSRSQRAGTNDIRSLYFSSLLGGPPVLATDIGNVQEMEGSYPFMRMDLQPVVMVTAVVTGDGPLYTALDVSKRLKKESPSGSSPVQVHFSDSTPDPEGLVVKWAGDWSIQRDLLMDLGGDFVIVLFLIYGMLVAWSDSFLTPVVIMLPIPLILIGVIPAHVLMGKALDATGLIGMIALAGIMVRNSILLVDFARNKIAMGMPVREAVLRASKTRMRPILLTALAVILGESVLCLDPLLQGLGYALVFGGLVSTSLTLGIVPVAYYQLDTLRVSKRTLSVRQQPPTDF
jgi:multidrug efflux pump subunit AcrB